MVVVMVVVTLRVEERVIWYCFSPSCARAVGGARVVVWSGVIFLGCFLVRCLFLGCFFLRCPLCLSFGLLFGLLFQLFFCWSPILLVAMRLEFVPPSASQTQAPIVNLLGRTFRLVERAPGAAAVAVLWFTILLMRRVAEPTHVRYARGAEAGMVLADNAASRFAICGPQFAALVASCIGLASLGEEVKQTELTIDALHTLRPDARGAHAGAGL